MTVRETSAKVQNRMQKIKSMKRKNRTQQGAHNWRMNILQMRYAFG